MKKQDQIKDETYLRAFDDQVGLVMQAINKDPNNANKILTVFFSNFFDALKESIRVQGYISPFFITLAEPMVYGIPPVTDEILNRAKELKAVAVVSLEGFQSRQDIGDVIYHLSMSTPGIGVMGWVFKVKLKDRKVVFVREMPYLFDSKEKVKTLGELITDMEH